MDQELNTALFVQIGDLLDVLDDQLETLQVNPSRKGIAESVFRTLHSIKGHAGFAAASSVVAICHHGEDLLDGARTGETVLDAKRILGLRGVLGHLRMTMLDLNSGEKGPSISGGATRVNGASHSGFAVVPPVPANLGTMSDKEFDGLLDGLYGPHGAPGLTRKSPSVNPGRETVRVSTQDLSELADTARRLGRSGSRLTSLTKGLPDGVRKMVNSMTSDIFALDKVCDQLRTQPMDQLFQHIERAARDLANRFGKELDLAQIGGETRVSRSMGEAVGESLMHLLRNAVDHGIEVPEARVRAGKPRRGRIVLLASVALWNELCVSVTDDGCGMDPDVVRERAIAKGLVTEEAARQLDLAATLDLAFCPGFTTRTEVSEISGRGVGLDVVRNRVSNLGGRVSIASTLGFGTSVFMSIPLGERAPLSFVGAAV